MQLRKGWPLALAALGLLLAAGGVRADAPGTATVALDPVQLAAKIDRLIDADLSKHGVKPAPLADDAEFVRRVYLDLAGRIPRVAEVRDFLSDPAPDKRPRLIETLLDGPQYVSHFSNTWRASLLPSSNQQIQFFQPTFKAWAEKQIQDDVPYDQMIREILTVPVAGVDPRLGFRGVTPQTGLSPIAFYQANEMKAENLAASASRLFLGVRLECAQCHDHPFADWKREQFWQFAAFFSGVQAQQPGRAVVVNGRLTPPPAPKQPTGREIKVPGTEKIVQAKFLDRKTPAWRDGVDSRVILAEWLTSAENPFFARMGANRIWGHLFGIGLIDPVDDEPCDDNPASHPELLTELTRQFTAHNFDVKYLIRAIALSKTYQRTSVLTDASQKEPRRFARMSVKGMTPEQLFDSLATATGYSEQAVQPNGRIAFLGPNNPRGEFLARFASQEKRTETQTSILQALALMNGKFVADATSLDRSATLAAVTDAPFLTTSQKIETLFLAALSRMPRPVEMDRLAAYVNSGGPRNDSRAALADVFWTLLNTSEFIFNH